MSSDALCPRLMTTMREPWSLVAIVIGIVVLACLLALVVR